MSAGITRAPCLHPPSHVHQLAWSNGQVEEKINWLKTIKRQMYGRANLDLLERRFLLAA